VKKVVLAAVVILVALSGSGRCADVTFEGLDQQIAACDHVLNDAFLMPDRGIPKDLLQRCRGLAIFPGMMRVSIVVGVTYGNGIVLRKDEKTNLWSKPAFFTIRGGSVGLQAGAQATDLILLIMSDQGLERLLEEKFTLGADMSIAAGPVGRDASAATDTKFTAGILSYSRSKGIFAGVSLQGASLEPDVNANEIYHGKGITVQDVLYDGMGALSENARVLVKTLDGSTK
jgi:SH3 domain-containing YSC84-like protein 1